ncbi:hypothetical protein DL98DRAFT_578740 [Cadophora sp. DSE1049]|nr:hypothetical protein DL98DRAFT_578740 [Cadophora sp. DSE1049]
MTANQCRRPNLPTPEIFESFSLCSFRSDADLGDNRLLDAITQCCTTPIKSYQCWNYCAVEDSQFFAWLGCIEEIRSSTWGAACQRVDHSVVSTITKSSASSSTQSASPLESTTPPTYTFSPISDASSTSGASWTSGTNATAAEWLLPTGGSNGSNSTGGSASPAYVVQARSPKALVLSLGGMMCSFLVLSVLAI